VPCSTCIAGLGAWWTRQFERNETGELLWAEVDADAVFVIDPGAFLAGTYRGHEEIRTLLRLMAETYDQFRYEADEFVDLGESILALGRIRVRGARYSRATSVEGEREAEQQTPRS
jgi:hypothetical protein